MEHSTPISLIKLILKLALFIIPVLLIFVFPFLIYILGKEFNSTQQVIAIQNKSPQALFGFAFDDDTIDYKNALVAEKKPEVIALGTSRVMEFRSNEFTHTFVNDGKSFQDINGLVPELKTTLASDPNVKLIIIGLDPWMFDPNYVKLPDVEQSTIPQQEQMFLNGEWRKVYLDFFERKISLPTLIHKYDATPNIGLTAIVNNVGFMNDGSYFYGDTDANTPAYANSSRGFGPALSQIASGPNTYEFSTTTSPQDLNDLREFLALCKAHSIYVIGFIPPYAPVVYQAITNPSYADRNTVLQLPITLGDIFRVQGYQVFNYTNPNTAGIQSTEFIDDVHTTDKGLLQILVDMAEKNAVLRNYVSLPSLQKDLKNATGNYVLTSI